MSFDQKYQDAPYILELRKRDGSGGSRENGPHPSRDVRVTQVKLRMWSSYFLLLFSFTLFVDGDFFDIVDFGCVFLFFF